MPAIFAFFRLLTHIYNLRVLLALYPIATMSSFLCGPCNGAGWIFQDQVPRTINNGGDTARIVDYGAQSARIDLLHFHGGILAIFRAWPLALLALKIWKQTTPGDSGNRQPPPVILPFYWFIARHVRQRTEQAGNIFQSVIANPVGCSAMNFINLVCWLIRVRP
jgi:hypothetical protein